MPVDSDVELNSVKANLSTDVKHAEIGCWNIKKAERPRFGSESLQSQNSRLHQARGSTEPLRIQFLLEIRISQIFPRPGAQRDSQRVKWVFFCGSNVELHFF